MEVMIVLFITACFAISYLLEKATQFIKQLKTGDSTKLSKGFEARLLVAPISINNESGVSPTKNNPTSNDSDD